MTDKQLRAGLMTRVSTKKQKAFLKERMKTCRDYAERQGWVVAGEYPDAITGTSAVKDREHGARVYTDALAGRLDVVVIDTMDRAARDDDALEFLIFKRDMRRAGVRIYFADSGFSPTDPFEGAGDYFKAAGVAKERQQIAIRTSGGRVKRAREEKLPPRGNPPRWYHAIRNEKGESINYEFDAKWRKFMDALALHFLARASYSAIARKLKVMPDGARLSQQEARRLISNLFSLGYVRCIEQGQTFVVRGVHKAVWDRQTARAIESELARRAAVGRGYARPHHTPAIFSGLIRCGVCGRVMGAHTIGQGGWISHGCSQQDRIRKNQTTEASHGPNYISEPRLFSVIMDWLANTPAEDLRQYEAMSRAAVLSRLPAADAGAVQLARDALSAQIDELEAGARAASGIVRETLLAQKTRLEAELKALSPAPAMEPDVDEPPEPIPDARIWAELTVGSIHDRPRAVWQELFSAHLPTLFLWRGHIVPPPQTIR